MISFIKNQNQDIRRFKFMFFCGKHILNKNKILLLKQIFYTQRQKLWICY